MKFLTRVVGVDLETALSMATSVPADVLKLPAGRLSRGRRADFIHLSDDFDVGSVWMSGKALI